jgi:hypothetical protein
MCCVEEGRVYPTSLFLFKVEPDVMAIIASPMNIATQGPPWREAHPSVRTALEFGT